LILRNARCEAASGIARVAAFFDPILDLSPSDAGSTGATARRVATSVVQV